MKTPSMAALAFAGVAATLLVLVDIGGPRQVALPPLIETSPIAGPSHVAAGGLMLTSTSVNFPDDTALYPDGAHADVINANCTACHSASMALYQPPLTAAQWTDEVGKMRTVYKAPIADTDVAAIVAYLTAMSGKLVPGGSAANSSAADRAADPASGGTG